MTQFNTIGVIGAGAFGTALAQTMRLAGRNVTLWARKPTVIHEINHQHTNLAFLPGVVLELWAEGDQ